MPFRGTTHLLIIIFQSTKSTIPDFFYFYALLLNTLIFYNYGKKNIFPIRFLDCEQH